MQNKLSNSFVGAAFPPGWGDDLVPSHWQSSTVGIKGQKAVSDLSRLQH